MTEQTAVTNNPLSPKAGGPNRMLIIGGIAALVLLAVIVVAAIILLPRLFGADTSAIAGVMPPKTSMLIELNALNLTNENSKRIARAFEDVFDEADIEFDGDDPASALENLDRQLKEATGLTVTDDILPWIGPNLGIGLVELDMRAINRGEPPQLIFAATIRDTAVADVFIEDLIDAIEDETNNRVDEVEYGGALVFEVDSDFDDERIAFGRSREIFFLATSIDLLEDAIDAQLGDNLGGVAEYQNTIADLPKDRALTIYASGRGIEDAAGVMNDSGEFAGFGADALEEMNLLGVGVAVTTVKEGIQVDFVGNFESLTDQQKAMLAAQTDKIKTAEFLPESTYVFLVGQRLDLIWKNAVDSLDRTSRSDLNEAMDMFDDMFGFNPSKDLLPLLNGEYSLALVDSDAGLVAEQFGANVGLVVMLGTSDGKALPSLAEDFADGLEDMDMRVKDSGKNGVIVYGIKDASGQPLGAYGISDNYLVLSTGGEIIEALFLGEANLAGSSKYKDVWKAFPRGTIPVMYVDVSGLLAALEDLDRTMEDAADVNPVSAVALGTRAKGNSTHTTMILFITGE